MLSVNDIVNPQGEGQQDEFTAWLVDSQGFIGAKRLPDGGYVALQRLLFTLAICVGVTPHVSYTRRYCFADATICLHEYERIESLDAEPEGWVARRPEVG